MKTENEFHALDALLAKRHFEPAFPALSERIINAAKYSRSNVRMTDWLKNLFADFHLPQPAYAFAAMLALGVSIGISDNGATTEDAPGFAFETSLSDEGIML